jgi:hypothetical protein
MMMDSTRLNAPRTVMPMRRNGKSKSQINGYATRANRASGQDSMKSRHQRMKVTIEMSLPKQYAPHEGKFQL